MYEIPCMLCDETVLLVTEMPITGRCIDFSTLRNLDGSQYVIGESRYCRCGGIAAFEVTKLRKRKSTMETENPEVEQEMSVEELIDPFPDMDLSPDPEEKLPTATLTGQLKTDNEAEYMRKYQPNALVTAVQIERIEGDEIVVLNLVGETLKMCMEDGWTEMHRPHAGGFIAVNNGVALFFSASDFREHFSLCHSEVSRPADDPPTHVVERNSSDPRPVGGAS